jgi:hypothetical protein
MVELIRLDINDPEHAEKVLQLQRRAYRVEAELIGSEAIPPLQETLEELQGCKEDFLAAIVDRQLAGAISWRLTDGTIDIHQHLATRIVYLPRCEGVPMSSSSLEIEADGAVGRSR